MGCSWFQNRHANSSFQSLSYKSISNYHLPSWRTKGPDAPGEADEESSLLAPSNMTLEIESGNITNVPSHLKKGTPNFHLLIPATHENPDFCKTVLSAMLLNYPPPTILNFDSKLDTVVDIEMAKLQAVHSYLQDAKHVKEHDMVLIVDGYDVWFQLPSDVMIKQYQNIIIDANERLRERYGLTRPSSAGEPARPLYNQTVIWGAEKVCSPEQQDEPACASVPESILPRTIYGKETDQSANLTRAKYLNAGTVIGPARDLRAIFKAAIVKAEDPVMFSERTAQSLFSTVFGEQEFAREAARQNTLSAGPAWRNWLANKLGRPNTDAEKLSVNMTLHPGQNYEFSMGLDYTHSLFQPLSTTAASELALLAHDNSTDLLTHHNADTPTQPLGLPHALLAAAPPFSTPNPNADASPNGLSAHFVTLRINPDLDALPPANTSWAALTLASNTYTGAVPAVLHLNIAAPLPPGPPEPRSWDNPIELNAPPGAATSSSSTSTHTPTPTPTPAPHAAAPPFPNRLPAGPNATYPTWHHLWYHAHARALLRRYLRSPSGPIAAHAAAVGGDAWWDMRGGRGGVWTERREWLGWGEADGVCGTLDLVQIAFGDGKGMWLEEERGEGAEELDVVAEMRKMEKEAKEKEEKGKKEGEEKGEEQKQEEEKKPEEKPTEGGGEGNNNEQNNEQEEEHEEQQNSEHQNQDSQNNDSTFNADFHPSTPTNSTSHSHHQQTQPSEEEIRKQEEADRAKDEKNPISL